MTATDTDEQGHEVLMGEYELDFTAYATTSELQVGAAYQLTLSHGDGFQGNFTICYGDEDDVSKVLLRYDPFLSDNSCSQLTMDFVVTECATIQVFPSTNPAMLMNNLSKWVPLPVTQSLNKAHGCTHTFIVTIRTCPRATELGSCASAPRPWGGDCDIMFLPDRTIFSFSCRGEPLTVVEWSSTRDFEVPSGTWGIAIEDSKIQRKLLSRILSHIGIDESRTIVLEKDASDVDELGAVIKHLVTEDSENKIIALVDENLDF